MRAKMAATSIQTVDPDPDPKTSEGRVRSLERIGARKAEKKKRKKERKKKRRAEKRSRRDKLKPAPSKDTNERLMISSPSAISTPEDDNSGIVVDYNERESDDDMSADNDIILRENADSDEDGSIEGTIISRGAHATLSQSLRSVERKPYLQALKLSADPDESDDDSEPEEIKPKRHTGYPAPEELPEWFPTNIKQIYRVDRHGGALSFKELNEITRYRAALEKIRRQKWSTYIKAGEARWKLQKILRRLRNRTSIKAFYQYRNKQYQVWKKKALRSWARLEKTHLGVSILNETIDINFRQERIVYEKKLRGRL